MKRFFQNDVSKLLLFLGLIFVLAAAIVPHLYNFGQFLADVTLGKQINPLVDSLGNAARTAGYDRYFNRSLYLATLILLPFMLPLLGNSRHWRRKRGPWSFALPPRSIAVHRGQPLEASAGYYWEVLSGFILASSILIGTGVFAVSLGFFTWEKEFNLPAIVPSAFAIGAGAALVEEIVFRGVILGIFLRTFRPVTAILLVALIFAMLHYLRPPVGILPANPEGMLAGFEFLSLIGSRLFASQPMIQQFITLLTAGIILGACRYRTTSLWLPIGLQAGWLFALRLFEDLTFAAQDLPDWMGYLIGDRLSEGLLPFGALVLTALIIWIVYREPDDAHHEINGELKLPSPEFP